MTDNWQALLTPEIQNFLHEHHNNDVRALALKKPPNPEWPYPLILDQIKARQKAKTKIPTWHETNGIIFPPSDTIEQASSEPCAKYKASLFKGKSFVDLTGGAGIDSWAMLENFDQATIIDTDQNVSQYAYFYDSGCGRVWLTPRDELYGHFNLTVARGAGP